MDDLYWTELLKDVIPGRVDKPRISGLTMVMDGGIPVTHMRGILEVAADHMDFWKLAYGSAKVYPADRIQDKISLCQEYDMLAYPGGTAFEIAYAQGIGAEFLEALWHAGLRTVEISDGTIHLPTEKRREFIQRAKQRGFTVLTEVGKKDPALALPLSQQLTLMKRDIQNGADYVIVEARESGKGIGIYDDEGRIRQSDVDMLTNGLGPLATRIIWEAPLRNQQAALVQKFGSKVNLGNVSVNDVLSVESLRRGLRWDTMAPNVGVATAPETEVPPEVDEEAPGVTGPKVWVNSPHKKKKK